MRSRRSSDTGLANVVVVILVLLSKRMFNSNLHTLYMYEIIYTLVYRRMCVRGLCSSYFWFTVQLATIFFSLFFWQNIIRIVTISGLSNFCFVVEVVFAPVSFNLD